MCRNCWLSAEFQWMALIWRWVQAYAPELTKRCRQHLKPVNKSYRVDETYTKVEGQEKYLYRAFDSRANDRFPADGQP